MVRAYGKYYSGRHFLHMERSLVRVPKEGSPGKYKYEYRGNRGEAVALYSPQALNEDLSVHVKRVRSPLLFLRGDEHRVDEMGNHTAVLWGIGVKHLEDTVPNAKIIEFPGAGHSLHGDQPYKFTRVVQSFFRESTRAAKL